MASKSRTYNSVVRAEQREQTRLRLLEAFDALLKEGRMEVSLPQVARHAQVSVPTAYNHFPSMEDLIDAYWQRPDRNLVPPELTNIEDLVRLPATLYAGFEREEPLIRLLNSMGAMSEVRNRGKRGRTEHMTPIVQALLGDLPAETARLLPLLIRHFNSSATWLALKGDLGLSTPEAAKLAAWATEVLLAELERNPHSFEDFDDRHPDFQAQ